MNQTPEKRCVPCEGGVPALTSVEIKTHLATLDGWKEHLAGQEIARNFKFKDYYHTMAFVNALAFMAHYENHHPDLEVGYNHCLVRYSTHAIKGLSENDMICAAKVNSIFAQSLS